MCRFNKTSRLNEYFKDKTEDDRYANIMLSRKIFNDLNLEKQAIGPIEFAQEELTEPEPQLKWFCRKQGKRRVNWDLFIMVLALYNCINVPYSLAFSDEDDGTALFTINLTVDILFMIDIIINFRTTYINEETGVETAS